MVLFFSERGERMERRRGGEEVRRGEEEGREESPNRGSRKEFRF
jgi:hypothetical protein